MPTKTVYEKRRAYYIEQASKWNRENKYKRKAIVDRHNRKAAGRKRDWHQVKTFGVTIELDECKMCGFGSGLGVHHIDGNNGKCGRPLNNSMDNLIVLCKKCHGTVHNKYTLKEIAI